MQALPGRNRELIMKKYDDICVLRDLVKQYNEICSKDVQAERRRLWSSHNSLKPTRPLIYVREGEAYKELLPPEKIKCEEPVFRRQEYHLRKMILQETFGDDYIFEPWLTLRAEYKVKGWGLDVKKNVSHQSNGSYKQLNPIKELSDSEKMVFPHHVIDEEKTRENLEKLYDAVGDLIELHVDRGPAYRVWSGDIATNLGAMRGIENLMLDMMDNPDWLRGVLKFMSDGILCTHDEAEENGDWSYAEHYNQAMPYCDELPWPKANSHNAKREQLWGYFAAQELTLISPQMHHDFMLEYQIPIMEKFGLIAYGCCEDLTDKIDILRRVKNLRRIAVAPRANLQKCAEKIGNDYVISWRPNPAEMVCCGFDRSHVKKVVKEAIQTCNNLCMDITLKDIQTVENDPDRLSEWVKVVRSAID